MRLGDGGRPGCRLTGDNVMKTPTQRSGRAISAAAEAKLREARDHSLAMIACIEQVLASNDKQRAARAIQKQWSHVTIN
jgi:triosephosphate isomerase